MKKWLKRIAIILVVALVVIQIFRPEKNLATTTNPNDINTMYPLPDSVNKILAKACYDCHSDNTRYPWYFNIQPVAWWMKNHIDEGKRELNFSEFGKRPPAKQAKKLKKVAEAVDEGWMPLNSYTWIHKDAILTSQEKKIIVDWAKNLSQQISAQLPPQK
jgi:hypothetical protein